MIKTIKELILKNILLVLLGTSVPYIIGYLIYKYQIDSTPVFTNSIWTNFYEIALSLLGSGIFLATLKYFQFLGFFVDEIKKVIYSDDYLKEQKNIYEIWQRVTKALFKSELPEPIVDNIISKIFKSFLTKETLETYCKSSDIRYTLSIDDDGYVTIEEWMYYELVDMDKKSIRIRFNYFISLENEADITSFITLKKLKINNLDIRKNDVHFQNSRSEKRLCLGFDRVIEDRSICEIEQHIVFKQSINADREFYYKSEGTVENMTVTIDNKTPTKLGIIFAEIGISTFKKSESVNDIYKGDHILPSNGFRLFFYTKQ